MSDQDERPPSPPGHFSGSGDDDAGHQGVSRLPALPEERQGENPIEVNAVHLAAAALFCAVKDSRYYLNGVYLEVSAFEQFVVATDGNKFFCGMSLTRTRPANCGGYLFQADDLKRFKKAKSLKFNKTAAPQEMLGTFKEGDKQHRTFVRLIDSRYPDFRKAIIAAVAAPRSEPGQYPTEHLADLARATEILGSDCHYQRHVKQANGYPLLLATFKEGTNAIALVKAFEPMPDPDNYRVPDWARKLVG